MLSICLVFVCIFFDVQGMHGKHGKRGGPGWKWVAKNQPVPGTKADDKPSEPQSNTGADEKQAAQHEDETVTTICSSDDAIGNELEKLANAMAECVLKETKETDNAENKSYSQQSMMYTQLHQLVAQHMSPGGDHALINYLKAGHPTNVYDYLLLTPLHIAAMRGNVRAVKLLLEYNANVNIFDIEKNRPLHLAVMYNHVQVAQILLDHGATLYSLSYKGYTVFDLAKSNRNNEMINLLLKYHTSKSSLSNLPSLKLVEDE